MSRSTLIRTLMIGSLVVLCNPTVRSADGPAGAKPRVGAFELHIPERSKASALANVLARMGWGTVESAKAAAVKDGVPVDYDLSGETFQAFVPNTYDGTEPFGLMVFVNAGNTGGPPQQWLQVLREHKLIWVGADNSGNNRPKWIRMGLAIDAAEHMQKVYRIDPARVYVTGGSGGGRISSMLAVGFPDVITGGGFPMIGCNYFRIVEMPPGENGQPRHYRRAYDRPNTKLFAIAAKERRHVLLTGDTDDNREQTEAYFNAMKKDGFKYVTYFQVPGMGHQMPDAEWFEKGIVALDAGREAFVKAESQPVAKAAPEAAKAAAAAPDPVAAADKPEDEPAKLMRMARLYINNRLYNKAREKLNQIVKDYPSSAPAVEAKKLLKEIGNK